MPENGDAATTQRSQDDVAVLPFQGHFTHALAVVQHLRTRRGCGRRGCPSGTTGRRGEQGDRWFGQASPRRSCCRTAMASIRPPGSGCPMLFLRVRRVHRLRTCAPDAGRGRSRASSGSTRDLL